MDKSNTVMLQSSVNSFHIGAVVLIAHMFHNADGDYPVILTRNLPVIFEFYLYRQTPAEFSAQFNLLPGDGYSGNLCPIFFCRIPGKCAPAAAQLQHGHSLFQVDLTADQVELGLLCLIQVAGFFPVSAGVDHSLIQHAPVEVIADVVVALTYLVGALFFLKIEESGFKNVQFYLPVALYLFLEFYRKDSVEKLIQGGAVPPAVHIGFTQAQGLFI